MNYWLIDNGLRRGPYTLQQMRELHPLPATPVWRPGLSDWVTASELPELADWLTTPEIPQIPDLPTGEPVQQFCQPETPVYPEHPVHTYDHMPAPQQPMPRTYLALSIIVAILCCIPFGIVAIVYSSKVEPAWRRGDLTGAQRYSENAELWIIASVVIGLFLTPLQIIFGMM